MGAVFDEQQPVALGDLRDAGHVTGHAPHVSDDNGFCLRGDVALNIIGIDVAVRGIGIDEDGDGVDHKDGHHRGEKGIGRCQNFTSGLEPEGEKGRVEGCCARTGGEPVFDAKVLAEVVLEIPNLTFSSIIRQLVGPHQPNDFFDVVVSDRRPGKVGSVGDLGFASEECESCTHGRPRR